MLKFGSRSDINVSYKCTVRLLDDTEVLECEFQPHHKGSYLLEHVSKQLNLVEIDYFGLRYVDSSRQRHWLDLGKTITKQVKGNLQNEGPDKRFANVPVPFVYAPCTKMLHPRPEAEKSKVSKSISRFRVKFYPPDPFVLKEEITRYQIYLQLKRDLLHGRLYCNQSEASLLGAYVVQAELGDYDPEVHEGNYVSELKILLKQTEPIEEKILEIHQTQLKGQSPETTETHFLKKACQLDTYGVDPHPVKDHKGTTLYLGINHLGILTFQGSRKTRHFNWNEIQKINYEGKMFIIHLVFHEDSRTKKKHTVGFKCPSTAACRHVWRCAIEQMLFFTLPKSTDAPVLSGGGLFSWGTKFKYSGRTEKEILEDANPIRRGEEPVINRVGSLRRKASSVPATPSTPVGSELGYSSLPRSNHSVPDSRLDGDHGLLLAGDSTDNALSLLEPVAEDQEHGGKHRLQTLDKETKVVQDGTGKADKLRLPLRNGFGVVAAGHKDADVVDDYYFRDSFDHSSSESQLQDVSGKTGLPPSHRSSRSATPQPRSKPGGSKTPFETAGLAPGTVVPLPPPPRSSETVVEPSASSRKFNLFQVFVPSFLFVAISLIAATVLVLESDSDLLSNVRRMPEMIALRKEYYEPAKEFLTKRISELLSK